MRPSAAEREIELGVALPERLVARADHDRVAQILRNYLTNAIRYASPGSKVTVVGASDDGVRIGVRDDGPGLSAEQLGRVFERFYRADPSRSRALGGSGIGLPIARALAEAMGGRAWAESAGPGHGSTFWIALPTP
jgi:histidine kinase